MRPGIPVFEKQETCAWKGNRMTGKKRIGELDVFRFVFIMVIVMRHFDTGTFDFGNIGVEFFFTLSGLLMARHAEKWDKSTDREGRDLNLMAHETWSFLLGKIRAFYKYYIFAFVFRIIVRSIIINHMTVQAIVMRLLRSIPTLSLSFFAISETSTGNYINATWYLSAMLIAMLVLYPILLRNYRYGVKIVFPILTLFLLGYEYAANEEISANTAWAGFTYYGILRAASEIAFGGTLYYISTEITGNAALMKRAERPVNRTLLTLGKVIGYGAILLYACRVGLGLKFERSYSLHALLFCGIGIMLSYSGLGWTIPDCRLTRYLGRISLPIFIFHKTLRAAWLEAIGTEKVTMEYNWIMVIVCVAACIVLMYVTDFLALSIQKLRAARKAKLNA